MVVEGIRDITLHDIQAAHRLGCKIKLLAIISKDFDTNRIRASVHPMLISTEEVVAGVDEVYNAVSITGDVASHCAHRAWAGQDATASAVISDIVDAVTSISNGVSESSLKLEAAFYDQLSDGSTIAGLDEIQGSFYLRLSVDDKPGVLARVTEILSIAGISISTVDQASGKGRA